MLMRSVDRRIMRWLVASVVVMLCAGAALGDGRAAPVNGRVETVGEGADAVKVLYTWGSPREMGYAQGKLLHDDILDFYKTSVPRFMLGLQMTPEQIDAVWRQGEPFVPKDDLEEMAGLADGLGGDVGLAAIHRFHIIPEISEWHCSYFAAWGRATRDGHLIQIRALDYATEAAIQNHPLITVAFPKGGEPFLNVGWTGFVGLVTGMSSRGIAMSEIGDDWDEATDTYDGIPMVFLMKDVVRRSKTLTDAVMRVRRAPRTSCYLYCLGDAARQDARALKTSHRIVESYSPKTLPHEQLPDCVYMSMGIDSKWNAKVGGVLKGAYGRIDPEVAMQQVMHGLGTGNLHAVCFDATAGKVWVANAEGDIPNVIDGFNRPFVELDAKAAFAKVRALAAK